MKLDLLVPLSCCLETLSITSQRKGWVSRLGSTCAELEDARASFAATFVGTLQSVGKYAGRGAVNHRCRLVVRLGDMKFLVSLDWISKKSGINPLIQSMEPLLVASRHTMSRSFYCRRRRDSKPRLPAVSPVFHPESCSEVLEILEVLNFDLVPRLFQCRENDLLHVCLSTLWYGVHTTWSSNSDCTVWCPKTGRDTIMVRSCPWNRLVNVSDPVGMTGANIPPVQTGNGGSPRKGIEVRVR